MAERTGTRSSARLTTPQSPPKMQQATNVLQQTAPRRSARAARSQSRDVSESEVGKANGKVGRRGPRAGGETSGKPGRKGKTNAQINDVQSKLLPS